MDAFRRSRPTTELGRLAGEDSEPEGTLNVSLFLACPDERGQKKTIWGGKRIASSTPRTTRLVRARGGPLGFEARAHRWWVRGITADIYAHLDTSDLETALKGLNEDATWPLGIVPTGNPRFAGMMEAAGIEPASADAPVRASTSLGCP